jgi:hypothetical protein
MILARALTPCLPPGGDWRMDPFGKLAWWFLAAAELSWNLGERE